MKKEANFQQRFSQYARHVFKTTAAFELKQTTGPSLPFSALEPHQEQALLHAKHEVLVFKIPDVGYQNPFDCFSLAGTPAYVVIFFERENVAYGIDIDDFIAHRASSNRKSITATEACAISSFSF